MASTIKPGGGGIIIAPSALIDEIRGPFGDSVCWTDPRTGAIHQRPLSPRRKNRKEHCSCKAFKLADDLYKLWMKWQRELWKDLNHMPHNSPYDGWMKHALWWMTRGMPAATSPAFANTWTPGRPGYRPIYPPPAQCRKPNTAPVYGWASTNCWPEGDGSWNIHLTIYTHDTDSDEYQVGDAWVFGVWRTSARRSLFNRQLVAPLDYFTTAVAAPPVDDVYLFIAWRYKDWLFCHTLEAYDYIEWGTPP